MPTPLPPPPYQQVSCPAAPVNTIQNPNYATNAQSNVNFVLNQGSNHSQIVNNMSNTVLYNNVNTVNSAIKTSGSTQPYMMFKSDQDRIRYLQAQSASSSRAIAMNNGAAIGQPAAFPAPTSSQLSINLFNNIING